MEYKPGDIYGYTYYTDTQYFNPNYPETPKVTLNPTFYKKGKSYFYRAFIIPVFVEAILITKEGIFPARNDYEGFEPLIREDAPYPTFAEAYVAAERDLKEEFYRGEINNG